MTALPPQVSLADPTAIVRALYDLGWEVKVYTHPEIGPFHNTSARYRRGLVVWEEVEPGAPSSPGDVCLPDEVWLEALRRAGVRPLPCLACFGAGEGGECMSGRCRRGPGLVLPRWTI